MSLPKTIRFEPGTEGKVKEYLKRNKIKFSQLVNMAVEKFISEPQTITFVPCDDDKFLETAKKAYKKHKKTMEDLK